MKKVFLSFVFSLIVFAASAQLSKDDVSLGASIANLNLQFNKYTDIALTPSALWFVENDLALGAYAKFGMHHTNGSDGSIFEYGIGPLLRYYLLNNKIDLLKNFFLFMEVNAGFDGQNNTVLKDNTTGVGFGLGPGISYFITSSIALEAKLKYDGLIGFGSNSNSNAYANGLNLSVGFQVYLPSQKLTNRIK